MGNKRRNLRKIRDGCNQSGDSKHACQRERKVNLGEHPEENEREEARNDRARECKVASPAEGYKRPAKSLAPGAPTTLTL